MNEKICDNLSTLAVDITSLYEHPHNPRKHSRRSIEAIKNSLKRFGQMKPIVARKVDNVVLAGNGCLRAAKELGWQKIAVVFVDTGEKESAEYVLADNRTAELSSWGFDLHEFIARFELEDNLRINDWWSEKELQAIFKGGAVDFELPSGEIVEKDLTKRIVIFISKSEYKDFKTKLLELGEKFSSFSISEK